MQNAHEFSSRYACTTAAFGGKLPAKLKAMKDAGFVSTEFWPKDLFEDPRGPDYAIGLLKDSGLSVCAYQALRDYEGTPKPAQNRVEAIARQLMEQMHWIGTDLLILCTNMREDASAERNRIVDDLGRLSEIAREYGVRVAWEHVCWGRRTWDYRDVWSLIKEVDSDNLGIMLDSLHIFCRNLPLDGIDSIDPRKLFLVELCDIPGTNLPYMDIGRSYRLLPGDGIGPVDEFLQRVEKIGYAGPYSIEIMSDHFANLEPAVAAQRMVTGLKNALSKLR